MSIPALAKGMLTFTVTLSSAKQPPPRSIKIKYFVVSVGKTLGVNVVVFIVFALGVQLAVKPGRASVIATRLAVSPKQIVVSRPASVVGAMVTVTSSVIGSDKQPN